MNPLQHSSSPLPPQESNSKPHTVLVGRDDNVGCVDILGESVGIAGLLAVMIQLVVLMVEPWVMY